MDARKKIEKAIEQRRGEAAAKNLSIKLMAIAKNLGQPILMHGAGGHTTGAKGEYYGFNQHQRLDPDWSWSLDDDDDTDHEIPVLEDSAAEVGVQWDGLSSGMNFQIGYSQTACMLKATYEGFLVYREIKGVLDCYLPSPRWEEKLESLYRMAQNRAKLKEKEQTVDNKERGLARLTKVLDYLRKQWGV